MDDINREKEIGEEITITDYSVIDEEVTPEDHSVPEEVKSEDRFVPEEVKSEDYFVPEEVKSEDYFVPEDMQISDNAFPSEEKTASFEELKTETAETIYGKDTAGEFTGTLYEENSLPENTGKAGGNDPVAAGPETGSDAGFNPDDSRRQDGWYVPNDPYGQNSGYNQNNSYVQNTGNNSPYGQDAGYKNSPYGQDIGYNNIPYNQDSGYNQNNPYSPNARNSQGNPYGQNTRNVQDNSNGPDGRYDPRNPHVQGSRPAQDNARRQYGNVNEPAGRQDGSESRTGGNAGRYTNDGYGKGRTGYSSSYDSYRFETPVDPAPINPKETKYGDRKKKTGGNGKKKVEGNRNLTRMIAPIAGIAALFGLIAALVFMAVTSLFGTKVTNPSQNEKKSITAIPTPAINFGKQEAAPEAEEEEEAPKSTGTADTDTEAAVLTVPQVVELCMPSMVSLTNTTIEEYRDFFGGRTQQESVSAGSGIIVGETETELLIATNNHVVQNSTDITVTFIDNEAVTGSIKGMDADNDLAIVAVKLEDVRKETKDAIRIISIGDSDATVVGETVVAIGNALGYGQSVSAGIVSALGREVYLDGATHKLIQTDASINPGNSGGALINMRGELIGINEVKYVDETVEGVGYAIPMATAEPILSSLGSKAARQKVSDDEASYIGIKCLDVPSYYVQAGYPAGVYVSEVTKGGPADQAGLKEGDIITAIDGISVKSSSQLVNYLQYYAAGEVVDFSVSRLNEDNTAFNSSKMPITLGRKKDADLQEEGGQGDEENKEPSDASVSENPEGEAAEAAEAPAEEGGDTSGTEEIPPENEGAEEETGNGGFPFLPDVEVR